MDRLHALLAKRLQAFPGAMIPAEILARDIPGCLARPSLISANGSCRLIRARDGWIAFNLARPEDRDVLPALTGRAESDWDELEAAARTEAAMDLRDRAIELQLPVAVMGETSAADFALTQDLVAPRRVVDLSALWAGPLCAGLLARTGAEVVRIASRGRPDPTPQTSPQLDARINGGKRTLAYDLARPVDRARLLAQIRRSDVLVTSARPAALARLGLDPGELLEQCPDLIWVAITAHGFAGKGAVRVGFGDDCAVAGGLVGWDNGEPRFFGDALADPLTGVEAALAVVRRLASGSRGFIDIAMARVAASYAAGLQRCP